MNRGVLYGVLAYGLWGFFPLYWKAIEVVPAREILAHRVVWSLVLVAVLLRLLGHRGWLRAGLRSRRTVLTHLATGSLLAVNWLTYIWAVNNEHIIESSLGYFINPLLNVALGLVFLRERLRRWQAVAVTIALAAVIVLTAVQGVPPWIALTLALTFGLYGLLRKTGPLESMPGFALETAFLLPAAIAYLAVATLRGETRFAGEGAPIALGLVLSGAVTAIPLLLFAAAARRVTLVTIGLLQYIAPTLQFLVGVVAFGESLTATELACYVAIWIALAIYSAEGIVLSRRRSRPIPGT
jgi:chloramphenicol-sensitive protein RarD